METIEGSLLVSVAESCKALGGIGPTTLYELVKRGDLVKVNVGRRGFITRASIEAYVDRLTAASGSGAA